MRRNKILFSLVFAFLMFISFSGNTFAAVSASDGRDSNGTYTIYTYSAADIKARIATTNYNLAYYQSNASAIAELIADGLFGWGGGLALGTTQLYAKPNIINKLKANANNYQKLLSIANSSAHGVKVKWYYSKTYATGLGMVTDYYGTPTVYGY